MNTAIQRRPPRGNEPPLTATDYRTAEQRLATILAGMQVPETKLLSDELAEATRKAKWMRPAPGSRRAGFGRLERVLFAMAREQKGYSMTDFMSRVRRLRWTNRAVRAAIMRMDAADVLAFDVLTGRTRLKGFV